MNPNLVLAAGFEAALDERRALEPLDRLHVRDRALRIGGRIATRAPEVTIRAAQSIAAIRDEVRLYVRLVDDAMRDGVVDAIDVVNAELRREDALCLRRSGEHHEAARILVEAMDHAQPHVGPAHASQHRAGVFGERVPVARLVGDGEHPGWLVDDHDIAVGIHDRALRERALVELRSLLIDDDGRVRKNACRRIEAALSVDGDAAFAAELAGARPRDAGLLANDCGDGGRWGFHGLGPGPSPRLRRPGRRFRLAAGALHEIERGLEDLEILLVVRRIFAVDLHPLLGARHAARL